MKDKVKYIIAVIAIGFISLLIVNAVDLNKEEKLKGGITLWVENSNYDYFLRASKEFMEENDRTSITIVKIDDSSYEYEVDKAISEGKMPNLVLLDNSYVRDLELKYENLFKDSYQVIMDNYSGIFTNNRIAESKKDGQILGIPFTSNPLVLYLREDMLNEYGYTSVNINMWDDLINMGRDIYERSNHKVKVLNATGDDYKELISLLVMQAMEESADEEVIKNTVTNKLNTLKDNNILNTDVKGEFLARISSINGMKELKNIEQECRWTANNAPAKYNGSNRFYVNEGKELVILSRNDSNSKLLDVFITYLSTNIDENLEYVMNGDLFLSYKNLYTNSKIEEQVKNFSGQSPLVVMSNIENKAPGIKNYDLYNKIIKNWC